MCDLAIAATVETHTLSISHRLLFLRPHGDSELASPHFKNDEVEAVKPLVMCPQPQRSRFSVAKWQRLTRGVQSTYHTATYLRQLSHPVPFSSAQEQPRHTSGYVWRCAGSQVGMLSSQIIEEHCRGGGAWNPAVGANFLVFRFSCGRSHPYPWVPHVTVMGTLAILSWFAFGKIHPACVSFSQPHPCSVHSAGCQSSGRSWGGGGGGCFAV